MHFVTARAILSLIIAVTVTASAATEEETKNAESELGRYLQPLIDAHKGDVAVAVKHLTTGEEFSHQADKVMPTASMIKFPIMVEAYRQSAAGKLDLNSRITLREEDKVPPSGVLTPYFSAGLQVSVHDCVRLMIAFSDNTATNLVLDQVGLKDVCEAMQALDLPETRINSKVYRRDTSIDLDRSEKYGLGSTTAGETVKLYELLHTGKLADAAATQAMVDHLMTCREDQKLTRYLPAGTKAAHKGGSVSAVRCEGGILFAPNGPIAICVMTAKNKDQSWRADNAGNKLCADIGQVVFQYFNPQGTGTGAAQVPYLARGVFGPTVETLQRTLNARLAPSPKLGVDGDFGPATEEAVLRFQKANDLEANGRVGPAMWKKLAPLVTKDAPVPEPEVVNAEVLPREPADPLDGRPFVTCKAWAITDGTTGELLWGHDEEQPLDIASTTKMMPAYVVCRLAAEDASVLEETVVFSARADNTPGSTAGVRAGEQLTVGELMYGLMLPSGNDASVALAEHFGGRFPVPKASGGRKPPVTPEPSETPTTSETAAPPAAALPSPDNFARFLIEMNRTAAQLGMTNTTYKNTHGLTEEGHKASAHDLARLAFAAMQNEYFRKYVATRQHGTKVIGASGYARNLLWKNTNRLLPTEGYDGVKTGTTEAAGACLVSSGRRGDDHLLVVVLGAASSSARYVDSRNLYRWAWRQRAGGSGP